MFRNGLLNCCLIILPSVSAGCGTRSDANVMRPITKHDSAYVALVAEALKTPADCDYTKLRMAYTGTSFYDPYDRKDTTSLIMQRAFIQKKYPDVIKSARKILATNFLDARAHIVSGISYRELGDTVKSAFHDAVARGLIRSIMDSGDGKSFETAFVVIAVPEEYILLDLLGLRSGEQVLIKHEGSSFDQLKAVDIDTGDTLTVYFNVDMPLRWADNRYH